MLAELGDNAYDITLVLHLLTVVIGFGSVFLNGVYGARTKDAPRDVALGIFDATDAVGRIAEIFILLVPITGIGLLFQTKDATGDRIYWFDQTWVWLSLVLYVLAFGIVLAVLRPSLKQLRAAIAEERGPDAGAAGQRVAIAGGILNVAFIVILVLMVFKPGFP